MCWSTTLQNHHLLRSAFLHNLIFFSPFPCWTPKLDDVRAARGVLLSTTAHLLGFTRAISFQDQSKQVSKLWSVVHRRREYKKRGFDGGSVAAVRESRDLYLTHLLPVFFVRVMPDSSVGGP